MSMASFDGAVVFEAGMPACSSSSSLGKDSDGGSTAGKEAEEMEGEVQSAYSDAGHAGLGALEESLPIRRGISKFYDGKSRSFTFLREAITPFGSSRDIAKADNAYTRKRKNLIAYSVMYDQARNTVLESYESGTRKRIAILSRPTLSLRPWDSISSSRSNSSSSISSEENELSQVFNLGQPPDDVDNSSPPMIPVPRLGSSCTLKTQSTPMRSLSMLDFHRLHRSCSGVCLKDKGKAD